MKTELPGKPGQPDLKLQKIKDKKYYIKVPGLKVPVVLSKNLFKKWNRSSLLEEEL